MSLVTGLYLGFLSHGDAMLPSCFPKCKLAPCGLTWLGTMLLVIFNKIMARGVWNPDSSISRFKTGLLKLQACTCPQEQEHVM